jgi:hypothetical protein
VDVGLPLPARRVRVTGADVLGLEPLEFLLGAEFVGLVEVMISNFLRIRRIERGHTILDY